MLELVAKRLIYFSVFVFRFNEGGKVKTLKNKVFGALKIQRIFGRFREWNEMKRTEGVRVIETNNY